MINFKNKEFLKLKETDNDEFRDLIGEMLVNEGDIVHTYKSLRDGIVFTTRRLITINVQGVTGKKKVITILPYDRIQAFSVETTGVIDLDSEMYLRFSGMEQIKFKFTFRTDVTKICHCIS